MGSEVCGLGVVHLPVVDIPPDTVREAPPLRRVVRYRGTLQHIPVPFNTLELGVTKPLVLHRVCSAITASTLLYLPVPSTCRALQWYLDHKKQLVFFFFTLVTVPRSSLGLQLSDKRVCEPQIRARLGTTPPVRTTIGPWA